MLRSVLQNSAVVLVSAYFTGDVSSASALVVSVPTFLLNNHYSRAFEEDADNYAFASLAAHHISPGRFAEVHGGDAEGRSAYQARGWVFVDASAVGGSDHECAEGGGEVWKR